MALTVSGSLCGTGPQRINKPCVAVKICTHGTNTCQTIDNILLDTASTGLRLFSSLVTIPTTPVPVPSGTLAECLYKANGTSEWGSVVYVDVQLASEPLVEVPIQLIDAAFPTAPSQSQCLASKTTLDTTPAQAGFNGILGVSNYNRDCGQQCITYPQNGLYYTCTAGVCSYTAATVQVQNPVALLPVDNNGIIIRLPTVPLNGAPSVNGSVILGIGTSTNNVPPQVTTFPLSSTIQTTFNGTTMMSNVFTTVPYTLLPPTSNLPDCTSTTGSGFVCPTATVTTTATITANVASNPATATINFSIANADTVLQTGNNVQAALVQDSTANGGSGGLMWGLPFFFGRDVYIGIEAQTSSLGVGPYLAF